MEHPLDSHHLHSPGARTEREATVAAAATAGADAAVRGLELVAPDEARARNPAPRVAFTVALWCRGDAAVEPRTAQLALGQALLATGRYTFLGDRCGA
ncbi:hypothetical protein GCM10023082_39020 [Streptomyces tremellae]|uniref:Uncharacterized protein n=1 Tax=Streptomyces tremellae TaxID=1124239 RepID=A0ABP7FFS6_9ACTN